MIHKYTLTIALGALLLAGCGGPAPQATTSGKTAALPEGLFLDSPPADAIPLHEARAQAQPGDTIAFRGYIGGRAEPFTEGRALFLVADAEKAPACTDECLTPWDACCTPGDAIAANSATVRLVDEDGKLLPIQLQGKRGLEPGAAITVLGTVEQANDAVLVVDATGLTVGP